jgi:uncharacterized protein (DUF302 family)
LIATIPAVRERGRIDPVATYERARDIAVKIATFVATKDESDPTLGLASSNWVLGGAPEGTGADSALIEAAILDIPTPEPIDPNQPVSASNTKKVNVLELCNKTLASKALGVLPVVDDIKVANGPLHATALPCEVAVYAGDREIRIEMLNAEAIFTLFFTDVLFGEQMMDPLFAEELQRLPAQVNAELPAIIYAALKEARVPFKVKDRAEGPQYRNQWDVIYAVLQSPFNAPYVHSTYSKSNGEAITEDDVATIAQAIVNTMTVNGQPGAGVHPELDDLLSPGSAWRSARPAPLTLPGNIKVIEGCSPLYAKQAMGTGLYHATALPCEIAVAKAADGQLMVSFLDPNFMFNALFSDAFDTMTDAELAAFADLPKTVLSDLQTIVAYTIAEELPALGIELTDPVPYYHDMFPF